MFEFVIILNDILLCKPAYLKISDKDWSVVISFMSVIQHNSYNNFLKKKLRKNSIKKTAYVL